MSELRKCSLCGEQVDVSAEGAQVFPSKRGGRKMVVLDRRVHLIEINRKKVAKVAEENETP